MIKIKTLEYSPNKDFIACLLVDLKMPYKMVLIKMNEEILKNFRMKVNEIILNDKEILNDEARLKAMYQEKMNEARGLIKGKSNEASWGYTLKFDFNIISYAFSLDGRMLLLLNKKSILFFDIYKKNMKDGALLGISDFDDK